MIRSLAAARAGLTLISVPTQLSHDGICSPVAVVPDDGGRSEIFAEASLGFSIARSRLHEEAMDRLSAETDYGYAIGGALGASWMVFQRLGVVGTIGYSFAPTLDNELGESHSGAGLITGFGLRSNF